MPSVRKHNRRKNQTKIEVTAIEFEHPLNLGTMKMLDDIQTKDPDFHQSIVKMIAHLHGCYSDKYAGTEISTDGIRYSEKNGQGYNVGNSTKYLQRYNTIGFPKSGLESDLLKAIHYELYEVTRKQKIKNRQSAINTVNAKTGL